MEGLFIFIEDYVAISYVLAVVFGTDALNKFIPALKRMDNRVVALLVPAILAVIFYILQPEEEKGAYLEKIFVSFLCAIAMYDFFLKPVKEFIRKKFQKFEEFEN